MKKIFIIASIILISLFLGSCLRAEVPYNNGKNYFNKGYYNLAINNFTEAIRLNKNFTEAYLYRGNAYLYRKDYDLAINDFNQTLHLDPRNEEAYLFRGNTYKSLGMYEEAIADWESALKINPNNITAKKNIELSKQKE